MGISPDEFKKISAKKKRPLIRVSDKAERTTAAGKTYDSKSEMMRAWQLDLLQRSGHIRNLREQVEYPLTINGQTIGRYTPDFVYEENTPAGWVEVVEEHKGFWTPEARLRVKVFQAIYGVTVRESKPS